MDRGGRRPPHESARTARAGPGRLHRRHSRSRGTLHAALGCPPRRTPASWHRPRAGARQPRRGRGLHGGQDIPGTNDCGPIIHDDPILADGLVQYVGQPIFIVVADTHDNARRAARKAVVTYEELPAILTPQEAKAAQSYVLPPMRLKRGDFQAAFEACTACGEGRAVCRRPGAVLPGRPDRLRHPAGERGHAGAVLDPAPERDAARGGACAGPAFAPCAGRMPAHGRRLRRQGIAVGAVGRGGRHCGGERAAPSSCAPTATTTCWSPASATASFYEYEVGYDDERPHRRREGRHGLARRLLGRPVRPGRHARRLPLRQYLLPVRRRHPRRLRQDQYPVEYGLPRLRRPAGRDRDRVCDRRDRAQSGPRCAGHPPPEFLRQGSATSRLTARSSSTT
jgi:hypothetical protein